MQFDRSAGFYSAPFPSDDLRQADGSINISGFPNPNNVNLIAQALALIKSDAHGFGVASGVFFALSDDINPNLPSVTDSMASDAAIFLWDVDRAQRVPVHIVFTSDGGPFGAPHLLTILPVQGIPLRASAMYAAVIRRQLPNQPAGQLLTVAPEMTQLLSGTVPNGMSQAAFLSYQKAIAALRAANIPDSDLAGLAVFTTDDPTATLAQFRTDMMSRPMPMPDSPWVPHEIFDNYCVYQTTIPMLDYQQGTPPYSYMGGNWALQSDGMPVAPHPMECNLYVTIPRSPMPTAGYPTAVFVRTGGGGNRPLVDRGPQLGDNLPPITPGTGPALYFAMSGFAGAQVDGPLGGLRNPWNDDEQYLIFNVNNAAALRDNVRESALELTFMPYILANLSLDTSACPGAAATSKFDTSHLALMGHSTGSEIATLALAAEPKYRIGILSGAGGSWIENIMYKELPENVRPLADLDLGYTAIGRDLTEYDPILSLVQWAAEPADDQVYTHQVIQEPTLGAAPRHILMEQGIVDHYILPPIALSESVPLGLDLGGPALDAQNPALSMYTHLMDVLPLTGHGMINLPASGNVSLQGGTSVTGVVVMHPQDQYEDGHEVVFQTDPPKHQYRCFLLSYLQGVPVVLPDAAADAPCQ
jgi:hypothetical protein